MLLLLYHAHTIIVPPSLKCTMPFDEKKRTAVAVFHIERRIREEEKAFAYRQEKKVVLLLAGPFKGRLLEESISPLPHCS